MNTQLFFSNFIKEEVPTYELSFRAKSRQFCQSQVNISIAYKCAYMGAVNHLKRHYHIYAKTGNYREFIFKGI